MRLLAIAVLAAGLLAAGLLAAGLLAGAAQAAPPGEKAGRDRPAPTAAPWLETAGRQRIELRGAIVIGEDDLREGSALTVLAVMRNGLIVPLSSPGSGVTTTSGSPPRRRFARDVRGGVRYAADLDVAVVEVIHWFRGYPETTGNPLGRGFDARRRENYAPDQWDFEAIRLTATLYRTNPVTGREAVVARRVVVDRQPALRMSYGVWSSVEPPRRYEPPTEVRDGEGRAAVRVLFGADGMKRQPAAADVLLETPAGILRDSIAPYAGAVDLPPREFWNHDAFLKFASPVQWRAIGRVGLFYRFGDHGLERDDWDVQALFVDYCPDLLRADSVCFRKTQHYIRGNADARLARLNGDGAGSEAWAPFLTGR